MSNEGLFSVIEGKDTVVVEFWWDTAKNNFASEKAGRPIFDQVLMCKIMTPGQRRSEISHEIERQFSDGKVRTNEQLSRRFADQIKQFKARDETSGLTGTPIEQWPRIDRRQAAELKALNIHTVEMLAGVSDSAKQTIGMGANNLVEEAKVFLEKAKEAGRDQHLAAENARLRTDVERLTEQVKDLAARLDKDEETKRGPGRPKKDAA